MGEYKPDKILADLAIKLAKAATEEEAASIQEQINQRQEEIATATVGGAGFGAQGSFIPTNAPTGSTILEPTYEPGVYTKTTITGDKTFDQYGRENIGNAVTLYDENGKPLSAAEAAKTEVGLNFAASGRDIGFGPGFIAPGIRPDTEFTTFNSGRAASPDAAVSAGLGGSPTRNTGSVSTTGVTNTSGVPGTAGANISGINDPANAERKSAYDLLYAEFAKYGLESLVTPLKGLITSGVSPSEFTIKLRETPAYQQRFAGNAQRIANGLTAIDEATYIAKEDAYQNLMRNYGLPDTYWKTGPMGTQEGFTKLIANDVSAVELENRLQTAQQRVVNANPEIAYALKAFYPDITNGDILAYALDPKNALDAINRKVTAAEIGGAALSQGLTTSLGGAEGLAAYGITKNQAQQGYQTIAGVLPRASQLADIYGQQPYNQATAEAEVFGTQGAANAAERRKKLISLETAQFGGSSGVGALGRDKSIYGSTSGQTGQF